MNEFLEYEIHLNCGRIIFEHHGDVTFVGLFRRKWLLWGRVELRDSLKNFLASFEHNYSTSKSFFSRDVQVKIKNCKGEEIVTNYLWKRPHATTKSNGRDFLVIFHKAFIASIFDHGVQIGSLKIPNTSIFFRKSYKLTVTESVGIDGLFWLILSLIYKLEVVDDKGDAAELQWSIVSIDPFQRELQPFDHYWKQK